ncbi:DUF4239 domain-containing protein [Aquisphaera insulae]|uniref:bestrophin-like domain n=1 Tax=Aquisphaera insulae TaxID=2712864 RepID=UPI0013EDCD50|nr:DUF4239 domain-containing protein [Aquisphaera insulae]
MPDFLYDYSTSTMVLLVVGSFVLLTWLGAIVVRPIARSFLRNQAGANDIVAYLLGAHGVYFGILLGLLSVSAYGNFAATEGLVADESAKLAAVYRDSSAYPDPFREQLTKILREYVEYIVNEAWPLQRVGKIPLKGQTYLDRFQAAMIKFEPKSRAQEILHAELFKQFNELLEARRKRVLAVTSQIPDILWFVVYIGALVNVLWVWMLDMKLVPQFFLGGITSAYLATLIALLGAMDKPFRGEVSVSPEPFQVIYEQMMTKPLSDSTVVPTGAASKTEEVPEKTPAASGGAAKAPSQSTEEELKKVAEDLKKADAAAKKEVEIANPDAALKKDDDKKPVAPDKPLKPVVVPKAKSAEVDPKASTGVGTDAERKKVAEDLKKADDAARREAEVANPDAALKKPDGKP